MTMPGEQPLQVPGSVGLFEREWLTRPDWPRMAFIEHAMESDPTNWWAPDHACVEAMVRSAGFEVRARPGHEIYVCKPNEHEPAVSRKLRELELHSVSCGGAA